MKINIIIKISQNKNGKVNKKKKKKETQKTSVLDAGLSTKLFSIQDIFSSKEARLKFIKYGLMIFGFNSKVFVSTVFSFQAHHQYC